jgi:hypothetical protein
MRSTNGETDFAGDVRADAILQSLLPLVVKDERPFRVVEDGTQVGIVDRTTVLAAMVEA